MEWVFKKLNSRNDLKRNFNGYLSFWDGILFKIVYEGSFNTSNVKVLQDSCISSQIYNNLIIGLNFSSDLNYV